MTHRDLVWRGGGLTLLATAFTIGAAVKSGANGSLVVLCFVLALVGLVLVIQGRHVPAAWRIERSRHRELPEAIRARRHRSRGGNA